MVSSFVFKRLGADLVTTVTSVKGIYEITSHWVRSIAWSKESNATYSELVKIVAFVLTLNFKKISPPNRITNGIQKQK